MILGFAGIVDIIYMYQCYLGEDGFIHLRYVRLIEKDGRKDGKNKPLYFISHELDLLRTFGTWTRYEHVERIMKLMLISSILSKVRENHP